MAVDSNYLIIAIIAGGIAGFVVGLFPLIIGHVLDQKRLGVTGIITCVICGFILGLLLAVPVALGFTVAIAIKSRNKRKKKVDVYDF
jgi:hypothetical protein